MGGNAGRHYQQHPERCLLFQGDGVSTEEMQDPPARVAEVC